MRDSSPRPSRSCIGTMAVPATEANAASSSAGRIASLSGFMPSFSRANALTGSLACAHQPRVVLLSCVPV